MNASRDDSIAKSPLALTLSTSGFPGFGSLKCSPGGKATRQVFEVNSKSKLPTWREFERSVALRETLFRQTGSQFGDDTFALQGRGHEVTPIVADLPKPKTPSLFEPRLLIRLRVEAAETLLMNPASVSRDLYVGWTITATHLFDIRFPVFD